MKKVMIPLVLILLLLGAGVIVFKYYEYLFAKTIDGKIVIVERLGEDAGSRPSGSNEKPTKPPSDNPLFAIGVRDDQGVIHTATSDDRQWIVTQVGQCARAKYFPYPPWNFENWGTFHRVRLIQLSDCKAPTEPSPPEPSSLPSPSPLAEA